MKELKKPNTMQVPISTADLAIQKANQIVAEPGVGNTTKVIQDEIETNIEANAELPQELQRIKE